MHPLSNLIIFAGLMIIVAGWRCIHGGNGELVTSDIYRHVRHPQYSGFMMMIVGFLIQWPTIITLMMEPSLTIMYKKLTGREEKTMIALFGDEYLDYRERVPAFIPGVRGKASRLPMGK